MFLARSVTGQYCFSSKSHAIINILNKTTYWGMLCLVRCNLIADIWLNGIVFS